MRFILTLILGVTLLTLLSSTPGSQTSASSKSLLPGDPAQVIADAAELVLLRVAIDEHVQARAFGYTGVATVDAEVRGTVLIGCDLTQAVIQSVDYEQHVIYLQIPLPGVVQVSVDHRASRLQPSRQGLWVLAMGSTHETGLTQRVFEQAVDTITSRPLEPHLQQRAQRHCVSVLESLLSGSVDQRWRVQVNWVE